MNMRPQVHTHTHMSGYHQITVLDMLVYRKRKKYTLIGGILFRNQDYFAAKISPWPCKRPLATSV